jgi:hypothetical protein
VYEPPRGLNSTFTVRAPDGASWRMPNHGNKVVYSDFVAVRSWRDKDRFKFGLQQPHDGEGFNRLVGNGAVHWLRSDALERELPIGEEAPDEQLMRRYFELLDVLP